MVKIGIKLAGLLLVSACAAPGISYQTGTSPDGNVLARQVTAVSTDRNAATQQMLVLSHKSTGKIIAVMSTSSSTLSTKLLEALLPGVLPAVITGQAGLRIVEKGACRGRTVCGDLTTVQVQSISGSRSGAIASTTTNNGGVGVGGTR